MALGGGTFLTTNKVLPGTYINFVSQQNANINLSDRGYAAVGVELNWGETGKIIALTAEQFQKNSFVLFGYDYTADELRNIREVFTGGAQTVYLYRLNNNGGTAAQNTYCTAKYNGTRGNDIKTVITANGDNWDVQTFVGTREVDIQTVASSDELEDNEFVVWKADTELEATTGLPLTGGVNGTTNNAAHQDFLDKAESFSFNILGCASADSTVVQLYTQYTVRMRNNVGKKFQCVSMAQGTSQDFEGVISLKNVITNSTKTGYELIYWVVGAEAGCAVNRSCSNKTYNGEYIVNTDYTQAELETELNSGHLVMHEQNHTVRVLRDINSLVTFAVDKGKDFQLNQVIRVLDQTANDIAATFNTQFYGIVPNDEAGRVSLWSAIVTYYKQLQTLRAIENFSSADVTVSDDQEGGRANVIVNTKLKPTVAMEFLYITTVVE